MKNLKNVSSSIFGKLIEPHLPKVDIPNYKTILQVWKNRRNIQFLRDNTLDQADTQIMFFTYGYDYFCIYFLHLHTVPVLLKCGRFETFEEFVERCRKKCKK